MILIALGANLVSAIGPPRATLQAALTRLEEHAIRIWAVSSFYATPAWPDPGDPDFVNAVASLECSCPPVSLLAILHKVETEHGRLRSVANAPRTLDLDLLDYEGRIERGPPVLPHPRIAQRGFVLVPLADIAPDWRHPVSGEAIERMIAALPDGGKSVVRLPD